MFDVGFLEILVIGIVSLIVIGPDRLPAVARTVGGWVGKIQRFVRGVKTGFAKELKSGDLQKLIGDQNAQISELRSMVDDARKELKAGVEEASSATSTSMQDFKKMIEDDDSGSDNNESTAAPDADTAAKTTTDNAPKTSD